MRHALVALLLPVLAGCAMLGATAGPERADRQIAVALDDGTALTAVLRLPAAGGPFPAVILLHGCDGPASRAVEGWRRELGAWGYATLAVDSFGSRQVATTCDPRSKLWFAERVPDAYVALRALATQPQIARDRIVLMGLGDGGEAAIRAASLVVTERFAPPGAPRFKAFVALYPDCRVFFEQGEAAGGVRPYMARLAAPVRIHAGAADERAPAVACETLTRTLAAGGDSVAITVYNGAAHAFDSEPASKPLAGAAEPKSTAGPAEEKPQLAAPAGKPGAATVEPGPVAAPKKPVSHWNPEATARARQSVREELATLFGPP